MVEVILLFTEHHIESKRAITECDAMTQQDANTICCSKSTRG